MVNENECITSKLWRKLWRHEEGTSAGRGATQRGKGRETTDRVWQSTPN